MQNLRSSSRLDKNEYRPSRYGALDVFMQQTADPAGILTPELKQKAEQSIGRVLETPVIDYDGAINIGNTRTVEIADSENNSKMLQITFATYAWGFTIVPAMYMNNEISMQRDFETKFNKYLYAFAKKLDGVCVTALNTNKTKVFKDALGYDHDGDIITSPWADRESVIGDINPILAANDFYGPIHIIGNGGVESVIRKMAEKGLYNETNKQLEYNDKILHFTNEVTNGDAQYGTGYAVTDGMLGLLFRFERECLLGTKSRTGHEWGLENLPMLNIPVGTYYYESVGDYNAIAGDATADMTRNLKQHYGFAVDIAVITAYNSDPETLASPIVKFQIGSGSARDTKNVVIVNDNTNPVITKTAE
jgi:hypothetical protein